MNHAPDATFTAAAPPASFSVPQQALWWLKKGGLAMGPQWQKAHGLCQQQEGDFAHDLVHALCHWIEGDMGNRDYWYRRVRPWAAAKTVDAEWQAIWDRLNSGG